MFAAMLRTSCVILDQFEAPGNLEHISKLETTLEVIKHTVPQKHIVGWKCVLCIEVDGHEIMLISMFLAELDA